LTLSVGVASARAGDADRDRRTFDLAPGSTVEISRIAGPVEIKTTRGTRAEVEVFREAPTHEDLQCGAVVMEQTGTTLRIRSEDRCEIVHIIEHVTLSVPADADLSLKSIAGHVRIGSTNGLVRLDSIAGHVEAVELREAKMSSLAKGLDMTVSALGDRGITVSTVTGGIDLGVGAGVNATLVVRSLAGRFQNDLAGVEPSWDGGQDHRAVLGRGGGRIEIDRVVGNLRIHNSLLDRGGRFTEGNESTKR
jgi:hypothetical protein